ncbi:MAG: hypothetical protein ACOYEJ_06890 [Mahellales bacterium]|jgi:hypothetical protein
MKKGLILVVVLLCVASLMAAMAYSTATVTNPASMSIVNTSKALLRLEAQNRYDNLDKNAYIEDGELKFNFAKGKDGGLFGVQKNSVYEWNRLFRVQNNSNSNIKFTITCDNADLQKYLTVETDHSNYKHKFIDNGVYTDFWCPLYASSANGFPYYNMWIKVTIDVPAGVDLENMSGNLIVRAESFQ